MSGHDRCDAQGGCIGLLQRHCCLGVRDVMQLRCIRRGECAARLGRLDAGARDVACESVGLGHANTA